MADETVDGVLVNIAGNITGLVASMTEAAGVVAEGTEAIAGSFEAMSASIEAALGPLLAIMALVEGGELFGEMISSTAELGKQLEIGAQKIGTTAEELSRLRYAADLSDVSFEQLETGMERLARNVEAAKLSATTPAAEAFHALGISIADANGNLVPLNTLLLEVAQRFATMEDGTGKTAIAMNLFGRAGAELIPLLNEGAGGIEALEKQSDQLGITMGEDDVEAINKYVDSMKVYHAEMAVAGRELSEIFMPLLETLGHVVLWVANQFVVLVQQVKGLLVWLHLLKQEDPTAALANDPSLNALLNPKTPAPTVETPNDGGYADWLRDRKLAAELAAAMQKSAEEEQKWMEKQQADVAKGWQDTFNAIPDAWNNAIKGFQRGGETMRDFFRTLMRDLVVEAATAEAKMLESHAAMWLARQGLTVGGVTNEIAQEAWAAVQFIGIQAAKAAAAAWAWASSKFDPITAAAIGLGTLAAVLALAGSFGGGGSSSGGGGSSGGAASSSSSGGAAPQYNVSIQTMDAGSFHDFAMKNSTTFAKAVVAGVGQGIRLPTAPGRG
jgi:HAMP domain-containing protein